MENLEYANAYSEVNEILKSISKEDYEKIPKSKIELFKKYKPLMKQLVINVQIQTINLIIIQI